MSASPLGRDDQGRPSYASEVQTGVEYARHDGVVLRGDLYTPSAPGAYPGLVLFHGGAWREGSPASHAAWGHFLARRGYVAFATTYRLATPERPAYPQAVHDCKAAVQFLRGQGARASVRTDWIGVIGASAGAQLAALLALSGDSPRFAGAYPDDPYAAVSTRVQAAVVVYGFYDLVRGWEVAGARGNGLVEDYLGGTPADVPAVYEEASPERWVSAENNRVPFLVVWGTEDPSSVPSVQSEPFVAALRQAGTAVEAVPIEGAAHYWFSHGADAPPGTAFEPGSPNAYLAPRLLRFLNASVPSATSSP